MTRRAVLLEALASTPADVSRLVRNLDGDADAWRPEDGWSCRDVVAHLVQFEPLFRARFVRVLSEDKPAMLVLQPDASTRDPGLTVIALAERFRAARDETLALLRNLSPGDWQRPAVHEIRGPTTLRLLAQDLVTHDIAHTNQLAEIQSRLRSHRRQEAPHT